MFFFIARKYLKKTVLQRFYKSSKNNFYVFLSKLGFAEFEAESSVNDSMDCIEKYSSSLQEDIRGCKISALGQYLLP